jgi:4'-phosphopantetheinyl transferase
MTTVEIWMLDEAAARDVAARWADVLSPDEHERALRYRFARDAEWFTARRAMLRLRIAEQLHCHPAAVRIAIDAAGKPHLPDAPAFAFSVTQTSNLALLALSWHCQLGIDAERTVGGIDASAAGRMVFSEHELRDLRARPELFFRTWTRKEALVKALGMGLSDDVRMITTADAEEGHWRACRDAVPFTDWTLRDLAPAPAVNGAIAVSQPDAEIVFRTAAG